MAKIKLVGGRFQTTTKPKPPAPKKTALQVTREKARAARENEKAHKAPMPRVKDTLSGLSLKQLYRSTPPYIKNNARDVIVKALKPATTKGGLPAFRAKVLSVSNKRRVLYDTTIVGKEADIPVLKQKHVLVSCSCDNFLYMWEYANSHWGSSVIKYSNGEPAVQTNPSNHPGLCKHLVAVTDTLVEHKM